MKIALILLSSCFGIGVMGVMGTRQKGVLAAAEESASLFLPSSYEQYLPLESAADASFYNGNIVVADGSNLYFYDAVAGRYFGYDHGKTILKVQFTPEGSVLFSDQEGKLFFYDPQSKTTQEQSGIPSCSTFLLEENTIYLASVVSNMTTFYEIPYMNGGYLGNRREIAKLESSTTPCMFRFEGALYCAVNNHVYVYTYIDGEYKTSERLFSNSSPVSELGSVCVFEGEVYYTVNGSYLGEADGLYRTNFSTDSERILKESRLRAVTSYQDSLYCVTNQTIRELKKSEGSLAYTGYEIGAGSASENRLSGATDVARAGKLVVIADSGNQRVMVRDFADQTNILLPTEGVSVVATDGEIIAAAADTQIFLYRRGETQSFERKEVSEPVLGLSVVYGKCYYVTAQKRGEVSEGTTEVSNPFPAAAIASDLKGNLYVAEENGSVIRYSESDFMREGASGAMMSFGWTLPNGFRSLRADYTGNIYYLFEGKIYRNGISVGSDWDSEIVYGEKRDPVSFAICFEDNEIYLQYGEYMMRTSAIDIPNLSQIKAEGIYETITRIPGQEDLKLVEIPAGTPGISVDLKRFSSESKTLPYSSYERTKGGRGVLLGNTEGLNLVALMNENTYKIGLFPEEECQNAPLVWEEKNGSQQYLTNEVSFTRYPAYDESLIIKNLPRLTIVSLLAEVRAEGNLGFDWAYVETRDGLRGYIPLAYLIEGAAIEDEPQNYTLGYLKKNTDGITFRTENGETIIIRDRVQVKIYAQEDGRYLVRFTRGDTVYTAQVTQNMIESGNPNAIRISIIIFLCVIAVGILAAWVLYVPHSKK